MIHNPDLDTILGGKFKARLVRCEFKQLPKQHLKRGRPALRRVILVENRMASIVRLAYLEQELGIIREILSCIAFQRVSLNFALRRLPNRYFLLLASSSERSAKAVRVHRGVVVLIRDMYYT